MASEKPGKNTEKIGSLIYHILTHDDENHVDTLTPLHVMSSFSHVLNKDKKNQVKTNARENY